MSLEWAEGNAFANSIASPVGSLSAVAPISDMGSTPLEGDTRNMHRGGRILCASAV